MCWADGRSNAGIRVKSAQRELIAMGIDAMVRVDRAKAAGSYHDLHAAPHVRRAYWNSKGRDKVRDTNGRGESR